MHIYIYIYVTIYIDSHTAPQHLQHADWEGHAAGHFSLCSIALRGSSPWGPMTPMIIHISKDSQQIFHKKFNIYFTRKYTKYFRKTVNCIYQQKRIYVGLSWLEMQTLCSTVLRGSRACVCVCVCVYVCVCDSAWGLTMPMIVTFQMKEIETSHY